MRTISAEQVGAILRADRDARTKGVTIGLSRAAERGKAHLMTMTKKLGKVHMGQYRASWRVVRDGDGYTIINDAPHAGVIELGARPHKVSPEGVEAIREWVRRKVLGYSIADADSNAETDQITMGIVRKLAKYGQRGTFIVRDSMPELQRFVTVEIDRAIRERLP